MNSLSADGRTRRRRVVILGQGYVGLPLAMRAVEAGYDVIGYDTDKERVKHLCDGDSFIVDVDSAVLRAALASGQYRATCEDSDLEGFDVAVIDVPTPLREELPDLSYVEQAARTLGPYVGIGSVVILESTTYPGTTEELVTPILESESLLTAGTQFHVGYSHERIDPGNPVWNVTNTPKVVSGVTPASLAAVQRFFDTVVEVTVPVSGTREAELTKLIENTFRHVNIALMNELAVYANGLGIDIWAALDAAATKPFGFMSFHPGPGVGGHCLPIDPSYLSWRVRQSLGRTFRFVELANDVNDHMPEYVVSRLMSGLNRVCKPLNGSRILVLGIAYKKNTGDARESPGRTIVQLLQQSGAVVSIADPYVDDFDSLFPTLDGTIVRRVEANRDEVEAADAIVLVTDHDAFDLDLVVARSRYVLDTRGRVEGQNVERL